MKHIFVLTLLLGSSGLSAGAQDLPQGAVATGMGTTAVTLQDAYSIFQNIAGLSKIKHAVALSSYHTQFSMAEGLAQMSAGVALPAKVGVTGLGVSRLGDELFSIHTLSVGYAHQIDQFSMGVRASRQQYSSEGYGSRSVTLMDIGGIARLSSKLMFGLAISNLNRAVISRYTGEKKAARIQTGLSYRPVSELMLAMEIEQQVGEKPLAKAGAEYMWQQKAAFRTGINSTDRQHYFGLGLYHRMLKLDYALSTHAYLGFSHMMSLAYYFKQ